jgi:glutamine synthetase
VEALSGVLISLTRGTVPFADITSALLHIDITLNLPATELGEGLFTEGLGFDGSSIRGWKNINESDMLVLPSGRSLFQREEAFAGSLNPRRANTPV